MNNKLIEDVLHRNINKLMLREAIQGDKKLSDIVQYLSSVNINRKAEWEDTERYLFDAFKVDSGWGSSRAVYDIDDYMVLKVANIYKTQAGRKQNRLEVMTYKKFGKYGICPKIFYYDDKKFAWLISERCVPATSEDFQRILGIEMGSMFDDDTRNSPYEKYGEPELDKGTKYCYITFVGFLGYCRKVFENESLDNYLPKEISVYEYLIKNNDFFRAVYLLITKGKLSSGDMEFAENWGIVNRNGKAQLVLLDCGLNYKIWNQYYHG